MSSTSIEPNDSTEVIVKADEIDQVGSDLSFVSDDQLVGEVVDGLPLGATPAVGEAASNTSGPGNVRITGRPELRRDAAAPPPPLQPPPPAPGQQGFEMAPDSLSLAQLKRIVQDIPKVEQQVYAFEYADCQPFPEELDEWFQYSEPERMMLLGSQVSFDQHWQEFCEQQSSGTEPSWLDASHEVRALFMEHMLDGLQVSDMFSRIEALEAICYTISGVWGITGGKFVQDYPEDPTAEEAAETPRSKSLQIKWIVDNVLLVHECGGIPKLFEYMRDVYDKERFVNRGPNIDLLLTPNEETSRMPNLSTLKMKKSMQPT
jgi:hypothetical protein